jgi:glycerol-3-phosphate O-acyltransferase
MMALTSTQENLMLKEVGASGQISLGKKFAGQLFDVQFLDNGAVQMLPVRVVPAITPAGQEQQTNTESTPEDNQWHLMHAKQIAAYNAWAEQRPTFSESVRLWREAEQTQQLAA